MSNVDDSINPPHWDLLSDEDKRIYKGIYQALSAPTNRNKRNKRIDDFREIIDAIMLFIDQDEADAWKRRLVCGVCKLSNGIAVNIAQLRKLIFKCKASINGSLKLMGYDVIASKTSSCTELFDKIPYLKTNSSEVRQWTIRLSSNIQEPPECNITPPQAEFFSAEVEPQNDLFDIRLTGYNTNSSLDTNLNSHSVLEDDLLNHPFLGNNIDDIFSSF
ncbi:hypothetical protein M9Y10_029358 [Tritrichomonas musculus]|uniref:Initiator binding domain-containing protein n=1 Tax=Tritrichomonas musculus TaxID=1915356 RepID=A0ABR2KLY9_9EUKA